MPCQVTDETYIQVKGLWAYPYRAVDKHPSRDLLRKPCRAVGKTLDFMLSKRRGKAAARRFFKPTINANGGPQRIAIDKLGANLAGLLRINVGHKLSRSHYRTEILRVKYLNNIVEHPSWGLLRIHLPVKGFIKKITRPTLGFKAFHSAAATLAGIEVAHMIRKKQIQTNHPL